MNLRPLLTAGLILLARPLFGQSVTIRPPYLHAGDTVGLVAPAAKLPEKTDTARIRERFESWGLCVKFAPNCCRDSLPYFSAPDALRAADLQEMIDDPSVKAVIACRGGYGVVRILPLLDLEKLRRRPKWIVGFSDITLLHLALARLGIESIHSTMPASFLFDEEDPSAESLRRALFGEWPAVEAAPHPRNRCGKASGRLAGGNLTQLCAAAGTPEQLPADVPTVLFIEETGEFAYRIDRMMQQLRRSGAFHSVTALLVGHLSPLPKGDRFGVGNAGEVIDEYARELGIPVLYGFPAGHEEPNLALYLGREVSLEVGDEGAVLRFEADETPKN